MKPKRTASVEIPITVIEPAPAAPVPPPLPPSAPARALSPEPSSDFERSLAAFAKFDVDDSLSSSRAGGSILFAVEAIAEATLGQQGAAPAEVLEEADIIEAEELKPEAGELPKIPLFSDLPQDAFIALFDKCPLRRVEEGELVFAQGSVGQSFFVICAGSVRVFRTEGTGRRALATLEEGTFFGEMALLSEAPRSASVEGASEDTQLLEISASVLSELSSQHPTVAQALKKFCRQRMLTNIMNTAKLFAPFDRSDRRKLVEKFRARDVKPGDAIIREGQRSDGLYIVLSGEVGVTVKGKAVASLKEGDVFGEMSLLTKSQATATVSATKRTSLLRLPREDFDAIVFSHPQVLELVAELTDERQRMNESSMV